MEANWLDIFKKADKTPDPDKQEKYLKGLLDDTAMHEVEASMEGAGDLEADALEGWLEAEKPALLLQHARDINQRLKQQLQPARRQNRKRPITQLPVTWWIFGLLLVIIFLAWALIWLLGRGG